MIIIKHSKLFLSALLCFFMLQLNHAIDDVRLLRFPAIYKSQVVFTYAGDLYSVDTSGGTARKITSHKGYEMFPRFSPDGDTLAFTGQYDGNTEVYKIPSNGGIPVRLTYTATLKRDEVSDRMGPNNIVMTWTPDGQEIVFRSRMNSFNSFKGNLFIINKAGGLTSEIPLAEGGFCSYSPNGDQLAFNQIFREFRTWKRYRGGMAGDIWIYDFNTEKIRKVTEEPSQEIIPMWIDDEIFFLSDRTGKMNLYAYHINTKKTEQLTEFNDYDIKFPSAGHRQIIFEKGGYLYIFHTQSRNLKKLSININNDLIQSRNERKDASQHIQSSHLSPKGKRVVFSGRGDIFTVPAENGITRNLSNSSESHERDVKWSPNGKYIAFISDKTGEFEIYIQKNDGSKKAVQLTKEADTYKYDIKWSPDSKKILWSDRKLRLKYINIDNKEVHLIDTSAYGEIRDYNWAPDSRWITYSKEAENEMEVIYVYNLDTKESKRITDFWYDSDSPAFSDNGKYLFFNSKRHFDPIYSNTEWNHIYRNMGKIYMITLQKGTTSPFAPENDEAEIIKDQDKKKESDGDKEEKKKVSIDFDGITKRIIDLPVEASNYGNIYGIGNTIYYTEYKSGKGYFINMFDLEEKKETQLGSNMHFDISAQRNKMLVKKGNKYAVIDLPKKEIKLTEQVDLSDMKAHVKYHKEWRQIFDESWRQMRDFFYVPNMHGVDWKKIHDKYAKLLPYVNHRDDLTYIIGEMVGELNVGHAYVNSGDKPEAERIKTGLLGAEFSRHESGYFRIEKILDGKNWKDHYKSPLTAVGVDAQAGDYLIAVNGNPLDTLKNLYSALVGLANEPVELTLNNKPEKKNARTVIVRLIDDESNLYYYNWVQTNIQKVNEATNGQVGYIHIPDMVSHGLNEFVKHFYPQLHKKGLIIDVRGNGGGNVSPMIIERLRREVTRATMWRNIDEPGTVPHKMILGPKVLIMDHYSASDGDLFPFSFKKHNLGPVIGERSWGGVVGIRGSLPFVDGGKLRKPEFASYSADTSKWIIEGHGVEPDIVVHNDPHQEYLGHDRQLQKAIEVIKKKLEEREGLPPIPEPPDKSIDKSIK